MHYLPLAIRCLIGTVFAVAAVSKVAGRAAFDQFAGSVRGWPLPAALPARPVAAVVVAGEFAVCLLLGLGATTVGYAAALVLLAGFSVAVAWALVGGVRAPCRCFGASAAPLGPRHLVRNAVLAAVAAVGLVIGVTGTVPTGRQPGGVVVAVAAGLVLGGLVAVLDDIVELFLPVSRQQPAGKSS
ncbi:MAG: MauE/DoxX family redox-associated membrane protein [Mycobacteriales bacterium]